LKMARKRSRKIKTRKRGRLREPRSAVLIVCEGQETEPNYFRSLWRDKLLNIAHIDIIPGNLCGNEPKHIVEYASNRGREGDYDQVWCVFDRNTHNLTRLRQAFNQAKDNNIFVAFSNPCFELWYLLHYQDQTACIERNALYRKLRKNIKGYDKSKHVYSILLANQKNAMARAEKLREKHTGDGTSNPEEQNPSTDVDQLVVYLNSLGEEN